MTEANKELNDMHWGILLKNIYRLLEVVGNDHRCSLKDQIVINTFMDNAQLLLAKSEIAHWNGIGVSLAPTFHVGDIPCLELDDAIELMNALKEEELIEKNNVVIERFLNTRYPEQGNKGKARARNTIIDFLKSQETQSHDQEESTDEEKGQQEESGEEKNDFKEWVEDFEEGVKKENTSQDGKQGAGQLASSEGTTPDGEQ